MIFTTNKQTSNCGCSVTTHSNTNCPICNFEGLIVKDITIKSQLKKDLVDKLKTPLSAFNFCNNPQCDTVYYSNDGKETFFQKDVKSKVTIKNSNPKTPLCYCRKLLKEKVLKMIEDNESNIYEKVKTIISEGKSFCEKSNPKGICCSEDVKNFLVSHSVDVSQSKNLFWSVHNSMSASSSS